MEGKILLYGPPRTGKSQFIKRIKGVEKEHIKKENKENDDNYIEFKTVESFPTVYVCNTKPDDTTVFDLVLRFTDRGEVIFEKGFKLDESNVIYEELHIDTKSSKIKKDEA